MIQMHKVSDVESTMSWEADKRQEYGECEGGV